MSIKEAGEATLTLASWQEFGDKNCFSFPTSLVDAMTRISKNFSDFQLNYLNLVLAFGFWYLLALYAFGRPFPSNFTLYSLHLAFTFFCNSLFLGNHSCGSCSPIVFLRHMYLGLFVVNVFLVFVLWHSWIHPLLFVLISTAGVGLHGLFRAPTYDELHNGLLADPQFQP